MRGGLAALALIPLALPAFASPRGGKATKKQREQSTASRPTERNQRAAKCGVQKFQCNRSQQFSAELPRATCRAPLSPEIDSSQKRRQTAPASQSPLSFKVGGANFTPFGFLDLTAVYRSTNVGSGIGTSFGSIPFNAASPAGRLSETRFSAQNSRIGLKVDDNPGDFDITGYIEADFVGAAPTNLEVTSHSDTLRLRLYWADIRRGKWEFLAGQAWSMMTPNRTGISPVPGDLFYTQDMDTNYQAGLVWLRTPGVRVVYHASSEWTLGLALEDPEQFTGGLVTFPARFDASQVDDAGGNAKTPNAAPDIIAKVAFDRKLRGHAIHLEAAGLYRIFRLNTPGLGNATKSGGGGSVNANFEVIRNLRLIATSFWSDGGGRYIFGLGPDFVVRTDAAGRFIPSPVHAGAGIGGLEYQAASKTLLYGYYGGAYFNRNFQQLAPGPPPVFAGFGFPGSNSGQNRTVQESTFGVIKTLWQNPQYGDLKLITQASYLSRNPWSIETAPGRARSAHLGMGFVNLRYDLP